MLFVNRASWAHCVAEVARLLDVPRERVLDGAEVRALDAQGSAHGVIVPARAAA
jgi:hypothetical protein